MGKGDNESEDRPLLKLLLPELLSNCQLITILREYGANKDFENVPRKELLELFKRVAQPKPRRVHGGPFTSRHKAADKETTTNYNIIQCENGVRKIAKDNNIECKSSAPLSRLKPPVQAVNFERKVIKLNSLKSGSSGLDRVVIKDKLREVKKPDEGASKRPSGSPLAAGRPTEVAIGSGKTQSAGASGDTKKPDVQKASTDEPSPAQKKPRHPRITFHESTSDKKLTLKRNNFSTSSSESPPVKIRKGAS